MSVQRLGARKLARLAEQTGLELQMAWSWGHPSLLLLRTFDDRHYTLDRRTGRLERDWTGGHLSSCPAGSTFVASEWEREGTFLAHGIPQRRQPPRQRRLDPYGTRPPGHAGRQVEIAGGQWATVVDVPLPEGPEGG